MPKLDNYAEFEGRHWETGSMRNHFAYRGITAPHTGEAISEALLMGISGGAVFGYFSFAYEGYDPQCRLLMRNTFDPWDTTLARLGVIQHVEQTNKPEKGERNLIEALEEGVPPIVWADYFTLPYNNLPYDAGMWAMFPLVVYGYDKEENSAWIADRAAAPLVTTAELLQTARARVKKDKFRLITLDLPNFDKLATAVHAGLCSTVQLYLEKPPKGSKNNFGLLGYQQWIKLLTKPKQRLSWEKVFPPGRAMFVGLLDAYDSINTFGVDGQAERDLFADFLDEAQLILERPLLTDAAALFRRAAEAWDDLSRALLPDDIPVFKEARELKDKRHALFIEQGSAALPEIKTLDASLDELKTMMESDFPLDAAGVTQLREKIADHVQVIHDIEKEGVELLQQALV